MKTSILVALALSTLLGLAVGWIALRPRTGPGGPLSLSMIQVRRAAWTVMATVLAEVLLLMWIVRLGPFGVMHLAWLTLSIVVPGCGLCVLDVRRKGRPVTAAAMTCAVLSLLMLPIAVKAQWIDPYDLRVVRAQVALTPERAGRESFVVGVLADLQTTHIGAHEEAAVSALMAGRPDIILVPGDLFQGRADVFEEVLPDFQRLLSRLQAPGGVWVVPGNTDYQAGLLRILSGTGATLLRDELVRIRLGDRQITLFGADEPHSPSWTPRTVPGLAAFESAAGPADIRILLVHRPRLALQLAADTRVDLVVAGHTHGGQVSIPFFGPPLVLSPLPRHIAAGGLHDLDGRTLFISRGVGLERKQAPRIRFLVPPEVNLLSVGDHAVP